MPLCIIVINSNLGRPYLSPFLTYGQFSVEKRTLLLLPHSFNPQFENVPLGVDGWNFTGPSLRYIANYSCRKFSTVHPLQTDRQTNDNHDNNSSVTYVRSANNERS